MRKHIHHAILYLLIVYAGCATTSTTSSVPPATSLLGRALMPVGRYDLIGDDLELIGSAAHFGFTFEGTSCTITASAASGQHGYLQYEMDGKYHRRLRVEGSAAEIAIAAPSSGKHTVWVYKATEAHSGPIFIRKVTGENIKAMELPSRPLIEFIGNSITCGAAADPSETPCGTGAYHDQHNAYMAYGPRVARSLNLNYVLSSVSGIGIYRNWNSDGPVMPEVYEKTDLRAESTRLWNFGRYNPAIVSIALGTNDFSNGDGKKPRLPFDSAAFTRNYISFVKLVKSKYPKAKIALLNSPMVSGTRNDVFVDCLNRVKRQTDNAFPNDIPVAVFLFKPMKAGGCTGHPNVEDHAVMAEQLQPFLMDMMKN